MAPTRATQASRLLFGFLTLLGGSATIGCGAPEPGEPADDHAPLGAASQASTKRDAARAACRSCAPPFIEAPGELEFSGQLIVRPVQGAAPDRDKLARRRLAGTLLEYFPEVDEYVIAVPARLGGGERGSGEDRMAADLLATGDYAYVTPNWIVYPTATPDDPLFAGQWHHPKMRSPGAWDLQTGAPSLILAVTDTGIDTSHPDLAPRRVPGFNAASDLAEVDGGDVADLHGHGTHVAGCAAAAGDNAIGVSGVGWHFKIMMVRVSGSSSGSALTSDITQGARWAVENGARVVSSSYAGVDSPSVGTTGSYIESLGGIYLYAAGNDGRTLDGFDHADVLVVGASDANDAIAGFSARGPAVDVFAPGVGILSTTIGGGYGLKSGTSMATPVANGAVGLIWSVNPRFTPAEVEGFLTASAEDLGAPGDDATFGWGRVDVLRGVQAAQAAACTHDKCAMGAALGSGCEPCATDICALDPFCCDTQWDDICVEEVAMVCGISCY